MVELATWIIEFKKYMEEHGITDLEPPLTKVLHMVTYRFIKIVVTCSSYNARLIKMDTEYTAPDTEKQLECFGRDLLDVHDYVTEYMTTIAYKEVQNLFQNENKDIHQLFIKLFFKGNALNGGQIGLAELKGNSVAFLISDVNVNMERFTVLEKTYNKIHEDKGFKIIWIPMLDPSVQWTIIKEQSLYNLAYLMPWYWCHPSMVTKAFFRYIVEQWNFQGNSILVVLDKRWNLISANALPMVETWGASAFPFSSNMDKELCIKQSWTIQSMVEDLEIMKPDDRSQIVCLYGGDDLDLIKSFLKAIGIISDATSNHIETVYVGTNERMENIQNIIDFIKDMNGTCLSETIMSSFWNRLDIILKLKREHCIAPDEDTVTMQMKTLLGYRREGLWTTMMYKGSMKFLKLTEAQLLKWFNIFAETRSPFEGTDNLWKSLIQELKKLEHSMHIIQLGNEGELLEKKRCPECGCVMDLYVLQKCTPYCGHIFAQGTEGDVVTNTICPKCKDTMKFEIVYKCHPMV